MKRIRTIFVSLVILLVSMTMALDAGAATPVESGVGTDSAGAIPPDGGSLTGTGDDGIVAPPPGTDGDPDDGLEGMGSDDGAFKPGSGDSGFIGWSSSSDGSVWPGLMDLWILLQVMVP
jgi:hypothetical protein